MKAVIFAAGLGTRLGPLTQNKPKALVEIDGHTLLENAIKFLKSQGIDEFIINIHHYGDQILDYLTKHHNFNCKIDISDERDQLLDTGGGLIKMAPKLGDEPFLIYNVDILTDLSVSNMVAAYKQTGAIATLAVRQRKTSRYLLFDDQQVLSGWMNKTTGEIKQMHSTVKDLYEFAFSGIHLVNPKIFAYAPDKNVFPIMPWYLDLAAHHRISAFLHNDTDWLDAGKLSAMEDAASFISKQSYF